MATSFRPDHLSYSQFDLYNRCPKCYFLKYVVGAREDEDSEALRFGSIFHKALASHYGGKPFEEGLDTALTEENAGKDRNKFRNLALKMFDYYHTFGDRYQAKMIEQEVLVPLQNPVTKEVIQVPFKAVWDLVTVDEMIVDHKTSSREYGIDRRHDPQLMIYSMMYRWKFKKPAKKLVFSVFRKDSKVGLWQKLEVEPDEIAEAIVFLEVKEVLKKMKEGLWESKMAEWWYTHHSMCDLAWIKKEQERQRAKWKAYKNS